MKRRDFLNCLGGAGLLALTPSLAAAAGAAPYQRLLILVEIKGGNDGLNTVAPYTDPDYYFLRPRIGIHREQVLQISDRLGFHPSLQALLPLWQARELAVVQGVGYANPNLSHFRSIEIWDTASNSEETLQQGWLARTFASAPPPAAFAADGVLVHIQRVEADIRQAAQGEPEQWHRPRHRQRAFRPGRRGEWRPIRRGAESGAARRRR